MDRTYKQIETNKKYYACTDGHIYKKINDDFVQVKERMHPDGYLDVSIPFYAKGSNYVHRVIAITFLGYPKDYKCHKHVVDHKNSDHRDNRLENLHWITQKENISRSKRRVKNQKILCVELSKYYSSISEASKDLGIRYCSVYGSLDSNIPTHGLHFEYR